MVSGGLNPAGGFYARLAAHVTNYRQLTTALESPGTRKGPPLYSGGALVAFLWDTKIREATHGQRGVGDLLRALLDNTGNRPRPYAWSDIQAALECVAPGDWAEFHRRYPHGTEPLPLTEALTRVGLHMAEGDGGTVRIEPDPSAAESAQALRRAFIDASS